jgi:hypothetical protein
MNAIRKYGDQLVYEVLLQGEQELCELVELEFRNKQHIGWNIAVGGTKSFLGGKHTEEVLVKLRSYRHTDEAKAKMSEAGKGKPKSEEHKKRIGDAHRGRKNTLESKKLMSDKKKGISIPALKKKVQASTGEVFVGVNEAGEWANTNRSSIKRCANGKQLSAGKHPSTKEKLTWKYLL